MRKLWSDHVFYTRNYIIGAVAVDVVDTLANGIVKQFPNKFRS